MKLLEDFKARNIRCFNSTDIVKWNMNKSYLLELAQKNINVVPTKIASKFSKDDIQNEVFPIVVKPLYGASGVDTFLLKESTYSQNISNLYGREVMIQPYMESIKTEGEYSFLFFNGEFSHAVLKQSTNDDFRIQEGYGGVVKPYEPNEQELKQIINIVKYTNLSLAYCRVDVVKDDNIFKLMELELIEPELFFRFSIQGEEKLVEAVISLSNK
jgi:glutathione synthase/RimK-type ligase-like ATP-grasp enzyme